ncbi:class II fructose-bisphosphate aldolase [Mycoplasma struthionis]|uniref:Class II fructose-bisphosphate aldolase n=1 Tax=Mycoplasma struthionis TaxID=538220 RepID=A0A502M7R8_9MOLU|nr:class II fructose-bisphosphate aldolase [Mycoplasma struthionis]
MRKISVRKLIKNSYLQKYVLFQININNLEWLKAIISAVNKIKAVIMIGITPSAAKYFGSFEIAVKLSKLMIKNANLENNIFVHLDHGSYEDAKNGLEKFDFDSVMYDGRKESIEKNLSNCLELIKLAKKKSSYWSRTRIYWRNRR